MSERHARRGWRARRPIHAVLACALSLLLSERGNAQEPVLRALLPGGAVEIGGGGTRDDIRTAPDLARALGWRTVRPGVELAEVELRAGSAGIPVRAVVTRVAPVRIRFALELRTESNGMTGTWRVDSAASDVTVAMNAGQFKETGPWGWLLLDGELRRDPLRAPLAASIGIDSGGRLRFIPPGSEGTASGLRSAFQSFPTLLVNGRVPSLLNDEEKVDQGHRDARLILAARRDGTILVVLTRFAALGDMAGRVPIGLTTPESVALVKALGAQDAVMLDGGISGQLLVRDSTGAVTAWRGLRSVPLGLVGRWVQAH